MIDSAEHQDSYTMSHDNAIVIEYFGEPVAKGRPRFFKGGVYTPPETARFEREFASVARQQIKLPLMGPLIIEVVFRFTRPRKTLYGYPKRPDLDNLIKSLDALNKIVWQDDSQISHMLACKRYIKENEQPGIKLLIESVSRARTSSKEHPQT